MRLIITLSLMIAIVYAMPVEELSKSTNYDHYVFVLEYPAGMCYAYFEKVRVCTVFHLKSLLCIMH